MIRFFRYKTGTEMSIVLQVTPIECAKPEIHNNGVMNSLLIKYILCYNFDVFTSRISISDQKLLLKYIIQACVVICMHVPHCRIDIKCVSYQLHNLDQSVYSCLLLFILKQGLENRYLPHGLIRVL